MRSSVVLWLLTCVLVPGCGPGQSGVDAVKPGTLAPGAGVIVNLFEWRYDDVGRECTTFLGPTGYAAVQVASPAEHSVVAGRPWWERYQPVSYILDNRSGDRTSFSRMVRTCAEAGVDVYVDAILNHMTGVYSGVGTAGSTFGEYEYPGLYDANDFHHCGLTPTDDIADFNDQEQGWNCELVNLADLRTESPDVRERLAAYLRDLMDLGVRGFRLDAARHIPPDDIQAILDIAGGDPYVYQETVDLSGDAGQMRLYERVGVVTDFRYAGVVGRAFRNGNIARLIGDEGAWDRLLLVPGDSALVFLDNHDTQRHADDFDAITFKNGSMYDLANVFMLAWPYGRPRVMSSYAFTSGSSGPPADFNGDILSVYSPQGNRCSDSVWICEHRHPLIAGMVGFFNATAHSGTISSSWTNGSDQIALGRSGQGFVVINGADKALESDLKTGMPEGSYCNRLTEEAMTSANQDECEPISVARDGVAHVRVAPRSAIAIY